MFAVRHLSSCSHVFFPSRFFQVRFHSCRISFSQLARVVAIIGLADPARRLNAPGSSYPRLAEDVPIHEVLAGRGGQAMKVPYCGSAVNTTSRVKRYPG